VNANHPTTIEAPPGTPFIDVQRDFSATPEQLFRAWTEPALVAQWLGPRDKEIDLIEYDARTGGSYRYVHRDADGREYRFRGVFHTVVGDERIVQTFEFEGAPDEVSLDSAVFEDLDGRTRLRTHTVFPSIEARDAAIANGMARGIAESMDRLEELTGSSPDGPADEGDRGEGRW
jgi:uncharacterized protein YndB with AHSA1/START domain